MALIRDCHYAECHYAECHYAECHYAECHYAECHYAECHYAEFHYAECHYAECHYAECHYAECHYGEVIILKVMAPLNVIILNGVEPTKGQPASLRNNTSMTCKGRIFPFLMKTMNKPGACTIKLLHNNYCRIVIS
jgi:hypothetical protein